MQTLALDSKHLYANVPTYLRATLFLFRFRQIYHWIGQLCNVIEKSRGAEIAQHISATHDLGCSSTCQLHTIIENTSTSEPNSKAARNFWMALGLSATEAATMKGRYRYILACHSCSYASTLG